MQQLSDEEIMKKTTYKIAKMDCPSEEAIVRMKLEKFENIKALQFDVGHRKLDVIHDGNTERITAAIDSLHFNSSLIKTQKIDDEEALIFSDTTVQERNLLWQVLAINFFFFLLEIITGFISNSMGLVADSLDMLADAAVYGLALFVVGKALSKKRSIAKIAGYLQLILAVFGFIEVIRRFLGYGEIPYFKTMIVVSLFALIGNAVTLYLLQKSKSKEAHIQASMIFTSTDNCEHRCDSCRGIGLFYGFQSSGFNSRYYSFCFGRNWFLQDTSIVIMLLIADYSALEYIIL